MSKYFVSKNQAYFLLSILAVAYFFLFPPGILLLIPLYFTGYYSRERGIPIFTIFVTLSFALNLSVFVLAVSSYIFDFYFSKQTEIIMWYLLLGVPVLGAFVIALASQFSNPVVLESPRNFFEKVKLFAKTYPLVFSLLVTLSLATLFILYDRIEMMLYYARY